MRGRLPFAHKEFKKVTVLHRWAGSGYLLRQVIMCAYSNKGKSSKLRVKVTQQTQCEFKLNPSQLHTRTLSLSHGCWSQVYFLLNFLPQSLKPKDFPNNQTYGIRLAQQLRTVFWGKLCWNEPHLIWGTCCDFNIPFLFVLKVYMRYSWSETDFTFITLPWIQVWFSLTSALTPEGVWWEPDGRSFFVSSWTLHRWAEWT